MSRELHDTEILMKRVEDLFPKGFDPGRAFQVHRSCGYRPLFASEPEEERREKILSLIPELKKLTGLVWNRNSYLLQSDPTIIFLDEDVDKKLPEENKVVAKLKARYPLEDDDFGYFLRACKKHHKQKNLIEYYGFWALDVSPILGRGTIWGKKFGI